VTHPILYDTHVHTPLCKHAEGLPEDYARVAKQQGLAGVIVTCHNPLPNGIEQGVRMAAGQFDEYLAMVEAARLSCEGEVDVRLGMECDYLPGLEEHIEKQARSAPFDYLLGSVHAHLGSYVGRFAGGSLAGFQRTYFEHLARAAELRLFDCLAHPDTIVVKNPQFNACPADQAVEAFAVVAQRIAISGVAIEINTSHGMGPVLRGILKLARQHGIAVVIGSDAHEPRRVGDRFTQALDVAEEAGYTAVGFFLQRKRHDVPIHHALASIAGSALPL